jgi:hypothetical protein
VVLYSGITLIVASLLALVRGKSTGAADRASAHLGT